MKQEQDESQSELKISLPSLPSLYMISFLCRASEEIHRIGGHVLDRSILQKFASSLLEKVRCLWLLPSFLFFSIYDRDISGKKKFIFLFKIFRAV